MPGLGRYIKINKLMSQSSMSDRINERTLSLIAGGSYWIIFFTAIFANFLVIEPLKNDASAIGDINPILVRSAILCFLITVTFDVIVAWALYKLFRGNSLSSLSTLFRMMHATLMGAAIFTLPSLIGLDDVGEAAKQVNKFNTIWLIGLFFFGIHIIILGKILNKPKAISIFLICAGSMYIADTIAYFMLPSYDAHKSIFLILVAIPSILGEMSFSIWLLIKGGRES